MPVVQLPSGKDFATALAATPAGGTLLLQRGGRYDCTRTPTVPTNGITLGAFGDPTLQEPRVASTAGALFAQGRNGLTIADVWFEPPTPGKEGLILRNCDDLTLERLVVTKQGQGITLQGINGARSERVAVRYCRIFDNYDPADGKGQGLYAASVDGLKLTGNLFCRNGWMPGKVRSNPLSHNAYIQQQCGPAEVTYNVFADAASHGIQMRTGGNARFNVFVDNPIHMSYGHVNGAGVLFKGGVSGEVEDNVFVGGRTIETTTTTRRGWGMEISNTKRVRIRRNIAAHDLQGEPFFQLKPCYNDDTTGAVGILDLEFSDNLAWDWIGLPLAKQGGITMGALGNKGIGRLIEQTSWAPPRAADLRTIVNLAVVRDALKRVPTDRTVADLIDRCRAAIAAPPPPPPPDPFLPQRQRIAAIDALLSGVAQRQAALDAERQQLVDERAALVTAIGGN